MFVGVMCFGSLVDCIGWCKVFLFMFGWYSVFLLVGVFLVNVDMFVVCWFLMGIGVGVIYLVVDSFLFEILLKDKCGWFVVWVYMILYVVVLFVGFFVLWLNLLYVVGVVGWCIIFVIGSFGVVYVLFI